MSYHKYVEVKNNDNQDNIQKLSKILLEGKNKADLQIRGEKMDMILRFLGTGTVLTLSLLMPGIAKPLSNLKFLKEQSDWDDWKIFNERYLKATLRKMNAQKLIEIKFYGDNGVVVLTENGKQRILENAVDEIVINRPNKWDKKWRVVLYDINFDRKGLRDHFQRILKNAGFFQLQESVYVHAFDCEEQIEFMRNYLGLAGEVRLIIADKIEDDKQFRKYFGV